MAAMKLRKFPQCMHITYPYPGSTVRDSLDPSNLVLNEHSERKIVLFEVGLHSAMTIDYLFSTAVRYVITSSRERDLTIQVTDMGIAIALIQ